MLEQKYYDLLLAMLGCRPQSGNRENLNKCHDVIKAFLEKEGLSCATEKIMDYKVLYSSVDGGKTPDILLNAHIDVVPVSYPEQWEPQLEGDLLYGRGPGDDHGNAIASLITLLEAKKRGLSVGVIFTADEEIGGLTTKGMIDLGYGAKKIAIVMDSWGGGKIVSAEKGLLSIKITAKGRGGHASAPWALENPIETLCLAFCRLRENWINPTAENSWGDSLAPTILGGGSVHNQIPDSASMVLNIRYTGDTPKDALIDKVRTITGLEVEEMESCRPVVTDTSDPALQLLNKSVMKYRATDGSFTFMHGATDARHLVELGIPIAIMGIEGGGAHSAREYANLASIAPTVELLLDFAENLKIA